VHDKLAQPSSLWLTNTSWVVMQIPIDDVECQHGRGMTSVLDMYKLMPAQQINTNKHN